MSSYLTNKRIQNSTSKHERRAPATSYGVLAGVQSFPNAADAQAVDDMRTLVANRERSYQKCFSRALPSTDAGIHSMKPGSSFATKQPYTRLQMPALDIVSLTKPELQSAETVEDTLSVNVQEFSAQKKRMAQTIQPRFNQRNTFGVSPDPYETQQYYNRRVTADLMGSRNFDTDKILSIASRMVVPTDEKKVFYKTDGLAIKNQLRTASEAVTPSAVGRVHGGKQQPQTAALNPTLLKLKQQHVNEVVLKRNPTQDNLQTQITKHKQALNAFYRKVDIQNVTESQILNGIHAIDIPHAETPQIDRRDDMLDPLFKNQMAKRVLQNICSPRQAPEQIPSMLVATGAASPDLEGVEHLKRRFEDNEADIISEIYSTHFRPRSGLGVDAEDAEKEGRPVKEPATNGSPAPLLPLDRVAREEYDSIEERDEPSQLGDSAARGYLSKSVPRAAPSVASYSRALQDQIKYVQYIPKTAKGTLEDAVNSLYMDDDVRKQFEAAKHGYSHQMSTNRPKPTKKDWTDLSKGVVSEKCRLVHRHTKRCFKVKETDIASLQTKAFKYMMLQKPVDEPTGFDANQKCRASFFPKARLPAELLEQIESALRFQRQMFIPDRVLHGRPMTTENAKSRFIGRPFNQHPAGRADSADGTMDSIRFENASNGIYQISERDDVLSNQHKGFSLVGMQPKYDVPSKPNLNIPIHQVTRPMDSPQKDSPKDLQQDSVLDMPSQLPDGHFEVDQHLQFQPNAILSPTTQNLPAEEVPDVDLDSNDMTQGLDKTSVSLSDRVNQLNLSQSKAGDDPEEELLMGQSQDKSTRNDQLSADQASMPLQQTNFEGQHGKNNFIIGAHQLQGNQNNPSMLDQSYLAALQNQNVPYHLVQNSDNGDQRIVMLLEEGGRQQPRGPSGQSGRRSGMSSQQRRRDSQSNQVPTQLLMRPLKHYIEPDNPSTKKGVSELLTTSLGEKRSVLNTNLRVKGGGGGLIKASARRQKTLRPKGTWVSPFAHRSACRDNKKNNLSLNSCANMERSIYVNHCLSLNSQLKPDKLFATLRTQAKVTPRDLENTLFTGIAAPQFYEM